jgi:branched-chain amino acid transport system ATP-binding protein
MYFGGVKAVDDVCFEADSGEIVGVIGPNGAGKSTLLGVIAGRAPTRGVVILDGEPLRSGRVHKACRSGSARTFQNPRSFADLSVERNVGGAALFGAAGRQVDIEAILETCGLTELRDEPAGQLSYSELRKLELARCLATKPKVLLLDEVGAGLNNDELAALGQIARSVAASGVAVVLVEHIMHFVMSVAKRVIVMDAGKVIADGTPHEVSNDDAVIAAYLGV